MSRRNLPDRPEKPDRTEKPDRAEGLGRSERPLRQAGPGDAEEAWTELLAELEERARAGLADPAAGRVPGETAWRAPELPPLPGRLAARAERVLQVQREAIARCLRAMEQVSSELSLARSAPTGGANSTPLYLDTTG